MLQAACRGYPSCLLPATCAPACRLVLLHAVLNPLPAVPFVLLAPVSSPGPMIGCTPSRGARFVNRILFETTHRVVSIPLRGTEAYLPARGGAT